MDVSRSVLFVLVFCDVTARCVRMSNRRLLIISVPGIFSAQPPAQDVGIFSAHPLALFRPQSLAMGGPAPLSAVTFFVSLNSGATICHGVPHKPSQFVESQASLSVCLVQFFASHNSVLGNAQNCSCYVVMTTQKFFESCDLPMN